jgi:hypothetical protein
MGVLEYKQLDGTVRKIGCGGGVSTVGRLYYRALDGTLWREKCDDDVATAHPLLLGLEDGTYVEVACMVPVQVPFPGLINPDAEYGDTTGWKIDELFWSGGAGASGALAAVSGPQRSGSYCFALTTSGARDQIGMTSDQGSFEVDVDQLGAPNYGIPVAGGRTYELRAWLKVPSGSGAAHSYINVWWYDGTTYLSQNSATDAVFLGAWDGPFLSATAPTGATHAVVYVGVSKDGGTWPSGTTIYVDDMAMDELP